MTINKTGAVDAFLGGMNAGNNIKAQRQQRQLTAQQLELTDRKIKAHDLQQDVSVANTWLQTSGNFKTGQQIPPKVLQTFDKMGINLPALAGTEYKQHRIAIQDLMSGKASRNDPAVLNALNSLAGPMLNKRQGMNGNSVKIVGMNPNANGDLMFKLSVTSEDGKRTWDAPATIGASGDGKAAVRAFSAKDMLAWYGEMDSMAQVINSNPDLAKEVAALRNTYFPVDKKWGNPTVQPNGDVYQTNLGTNEAKLLSRGGVTGKGRKGGSGVGGAGYKGSDDRDTDIFKQVTKIFPDGNANLIASTASFAQELDRTTQGTMGITTLSDIAIKHKEGIPFTPEQAQAMAASQAQDLLKENSDVFDNFFGFHSDDNQAKWEQQQAITLLKEAPKVYQSKLDNTLALFQSEKTGKGLPDGQQYAEAGKGAGINAAVTPDIESLTARFGADNAQKIMAKVDSKQTGIANDLPATAAGGQTGKPSSMIEALAQISATNPGMSDLEIQAQAEQLMTGAAALSAQPIAKAAGIPAKAQISPKPTSQPVATESDLITAIGKQSKYDTSGDYRKPLKKNTPSPLRQEILAAIDKDTGRAKQEYDKTGLKKGQSLATFDKTKREKARLKFVALRDYRKAIGKGDTPNSALVKKVLPFLTGRSKQLAQAILKKSGTQIANSNKTAQGVDA